MRTWQRVGFSGILLGVIVLGMIVPGCGGGDSGQTGPNPEVKIVPPKDAQGKSYSLDDETAIPSK